MEPHEPNPQAPYPVRVATRLPLRYEKIQVLLRVLVCVAIGAFLQSTGGPLGLLYLSLPIAAAVLITRRGEHGYLTQDARWLGNVIEWVVGLYGYLLFVTDRFPLDVEDRSVRVQVLPQGTPTVGRALARLVTSIPLAIVLALLLVASLVVWVIAAVAILIDERYPEPLRRFQYNVVTFLGRWLAYHASLVEPWPPFDFWSEPTQPPTGSA